MKKKKVIVALSGGVDSSVSAALLQRDGFDVVGVFMRCWDGTEKGCTVVEDERMARMAAAHLGIPFYSLNLVKEYKDRVISYMLKGYEEGVTPNPDAMCNREMKFGLFFERAVAMGAELVATGHYAEVRNGKIYAGKDATKDQSYFLSMVPPEVLDRVLFPVGGYQKTYVRRLAKQFGLPTASRPDSQGLCFVGKVNVQEFLRASLRPRKGDIVDTEGNLLGRHDGTKYYTIGQRKGLRVSGGPWYVASKDRERNLLTVSRSEKDLERSELLMRSPNWFSAPREGRFSARIRYRQEPVSCRLEQRSKGWGVVFDEPQRAVTPGQLAALYRGRELVGGGVISEQ